MCSSGPPRLPWLETAWKQWGGGGDQGTVGDHIVENHRTHQKGKERIFSFPIF